VSTLSEVCDATHACLRIKLNGVDAGQRAALPSCSHRISAANPLPCPTPMTAQAVPKSRTRREWRVLRQTSPETQHRLPARRAWQIELCCAKRLHFN